MSPSSSLPLLATTITHPAARSLCDSWASCFSPNKRIRRNPENFDVALCDEQNFQLLQLQLYIARELADTQATGGSCILVVLPITIWSCCATKNGRYDLWTEVVGYVEDVTRNISVAFTARQLAQLIVSFMCVVWTDHLRQLKCYAQVVGVVMHCMLTAESIGFSNTSVFCCCGAANVLNKTYRFFGIFSL